MFASVLPRQMDATHPRALSPGSQNVLMAHPGNPEMDRLAAYLGDSYRLFPVRTERQLYNLLEQQPIHLVIIYVAPAKTQTSLQLCSSLKSNPRFAHLPVILVNPANDPKAHIACLESGSDACLETTFSRDYVRAQVQNVLANRYRLQLYHNRSLLLGREPVTDRGEDEIFLSRLTRLLSDNLDDKSLDVCVLARLMNVSRPTLYRKIRSISEHTPNELINTFRLYKAAELLSTDDCKIIEIVKMVGFHSRSNFGKAFLKFFGITPRTYRRMSKC